MTNGGPARQPGEPEKRALCIEEGASREKLKLWKLYVFFVELESYFLGVITVNDAENRIEIA
jgi:hypothetical protein